MFDRILKAIILDKCPYPCNVMQDKVGRNALPLLVVLKSVK